MLTISPIKSSNEAVLYFEKDNYYTEDEGVKNSQWLGEGSEYLQLNGKPVDPKIFKEFLEGKLDGVQLGRQTKEGIQHRPGWDLTFSAPKSVSILSEVYGYKDIRQAHLNAVKKALEYIQSNAAITRLKEGDTISHVNTENSIFATFTHDVSRELDPQLHTHSIMINATHTKNGWRSLSTEKLFELPKRGGMVYRSALAVELNKLGYKLRNHRSGPEFFEIDGVPQSLIDDFSERSKQIKAYFKNKSLAYDPKLAKQIALITRRAKSSVDRDELTQAWKKRLENLDLKVKADRSNRKIDNSDSTERSKMVRRIVRKSIRHHLEKDMSFKSIDVGKTAQQMSLGQIYYNEIEDEINRLIDNKYLQEAPYHTDNKSQPLWTTKKMKNMERELVDFIGRNKDTHSPLVAETTAKRFLQKQGLNDQQLNALLKAVNSKDRAFAIQGDPGVGKTYTLNSYRKLLNKQGYDVIGLAPTYQATNELTSSLQIPGMTVDRFLVDPKSAKLGTPNSRQVWFVDESSMLSIDKMNTLLDRAEKQDARVLLVGDHKQLEAVGAGRAFYQLQREGLETALIDKRMRQKNELLQDVVQKVMDKKYTAALTALNKNNSVIEERSGSGMNSTQALANEWLSRDKERRNNTLIVAPTNEQRKAVNNTIRDALKLRNDIGKLDYTILTLEDRYLTNQEKRLSSSYERGNVVRFSRDFKASDRNKNDFIKKHEYFDVVGFNHDKNLLALKSRDDKRTIYIDPILKGGNIKGGIQVFDENKNEFSKGDKVRWIDNTNKSGLKRNTEGVVQGIGEGYIRIKTKEKSIKLDVNIEANRHFCHDYAKTAYGVQGKTEKEVLALMDSKRINTTNQRAFMVAVTRAQDSVKIYTDSTSKLSRTLHKRSGDNTEALTQSERKQRSKRAQNKVKNDFSRILPLM